MGWADRCYEKSDTLNWMDRRSNTPPHHRQKEQMKKKSNYGKKDITNLMINYEKLIAKIRNYLKN
jgi:hypothetical protein